MTGAAAIFACLLAAVEISVSPDQPLGYSYIDDPLIVEIRSDENVTADILVTLSPSAEGAEVRQSFPETTLGPDVNRWCALKQIPPIRGPWNVAVVVRTADGESTHEAPVYRIDRPAGGHVHPIYAFGDALDRATLLALRNVAVRHVRVPAAHPDIATLLAELDALGMQAIIVLDPAADAPGAAAALGAAACGAIARWELDASGGNPEALVGVLESIQGLPCSLPVSLGIRDAGSLPAILSAVGARGAEHITIREGDGGAAVLEAVRTALAAPGNESPAVDLVCDRATGAEFLQAYFEALARGATRVGFPARLVMDGSTLQPGLAYLNGLAHGIAPSAYAGSLPGAKKTRAHLFTTGEHWTMAIWSLEDATTLSLPWSGDHPVSLLDGWGNPLPLDPPDGDSWACPATPDVRFLQGMGGPILRSALEGEVSSAVKQLLARKDLAGAWSESNRDTLAAVGAAPVSDESRVHFFALLRAFPDIEEHWHAGDVARPVAVAALSGLADLARTLCRLEAARGATFLEPIQDTLARCEEYQSRYLTGSTTSPQARERGDWLVEEVRRLMDEVESLLGAGARIEADAVAALAEWRARGLEFAAKAGPLSDQMALPAPEAAPAPEPEEQTTNTTKGKKKR